MKHRIVKIIFVALIGLTFFGSAHAANLSNAFGQNSALDTSAGKAGYQTGMAGTPMTVEDIIANIIQVLLSFIGVIFLLLIIYGGYNWMTAAGDSSKVETAKNTITRAVIGLIVVLAAYAISYFVIKSLGTNTLNTTTLN